MSVLVKSEILSKLKELKPRFYKEDFSLWFWIGSHDEYDKLLG